MSKTLYEKLQDAKKEYDIAHVSFFNNGEIRSDENYMLKLMKDANDPREFEGIEEVFVNAAKSYSRSYQFDSIEMNLILGLIYNTTEFDENHQLKENAEPIKGIVRYYTGDVNCYLDDEKTNTLDYGHYAPTRQGYISYKELMSAIKKSGLSYTGPKTFEDFEEHILVGEPFDIKISADFRKKEKTNTFAKTK